MKQCKKIGCTVEFQFSDPNDYCPKCRGVAASNDEFLRQELEPETQTSSGGDNGYWLLHIPHPKRLDPYTVECEDIIEAMNMTFQEGEAFKALFRKCKIRMGDGKPGDTELRCSEKVAHFGARMVAMESRK
ncbi:hypothetical protein [uncultured Marinobacter sp.]|uniref:hypothetical protein n=1 Tax=uncultured Marinobacter sp. TaxID=187379 RepID=UPI002595670F|nr:hypothetical protein [uncultured Marinobacter sp.]